MKKQHDSHLKCCQSGDSQVSRQCPRLLLLRLVFSLRFLSCWEPRRRGEGYLRASGDLSARVRFLRRRQRESRRLSEDLLTLTFLFNRLRLLLFVGSRGVNVSTSENPPTGRALTFTDINNTPLPRLTLRASGGGSSHRLISSSFFFVLSAAKQRTRQHPFGHLARIQRG